uniref:Uncharacterized protein n=1 Tax=Anopheles culicifacies TaxID=139723 RepID=A0A182MQN9_9DIPT
MDDVWSLREDQTIDFQRFKTVIGTVPNRHNRGKAYSLQPVCGRCERPSPVPYSPTSSGCGLPITFETPKTVKTIYLRPYKDIFPGGGHNQLSSLYPQPVMERSGGGGGSGGGGSGGPTPSSLDAMNDSSGLCLQDLVGVNGGTGTGGGGNAGGTGGGGGTGSNNTLADHLHGSGTHHGTHTHHSLHDGLVSGGVSVSSAITSLMSPGGINTGGLGHLHHGAPDLSAHHHHHHHHHQHHHSSALHEPLEKLKLRR